MNNTIEKVFAREIIDSRGNPTIEVDVTTNNGIMGRASVPSGASTGEYEAIELRDKDQNRYLGKGVLNVANTINTLIEPALKGFNVKKLTLVSIIKQIGRTNTEKVSFCQSTPHFMEKLSLWIY